MELKDVILSTLAEMEEVPVKATVNSQVKVEECNSQVSEETPKTLVVEESSYDNESIFLHSIKERVLVLFEGFQSPTNTNIEAKIDITLNFLEYTLAAIDSRIDILEKGRKS